MITCETANCNICGAILDLKGIKENKLYIMPCPFCFEKETKIVVYKYVKEQGLQKDMKDFVLNMLGSLFSDMVDLAKYEIANGAFDEEEFKTKCEAMLKDKLENWEVKK